LSGLRSKEVEEVDQSSFLIEREIDGEEVGLVDEVELLQVKGSVIIVVNMVTGREIVQMETGVIDALGAVKLDICSVNVWAQIVLVVIPLREATQIQGNLDQEVVADEGIVISLEVLDVGDQIVVGLGIMIVREVRSVQDQLNVLGIG